MAGKTNKKQSKRSPALTEANKRRQAKAREKRALKRIGQAAQKRLARRAIIADKRLTDPTFARKYTEPDGNFIHQALNQDSRGIDQVIYSCIYKPSKYASQKPPGMPLG